MAELTPIVPSPVVANVRKVEREKERHNERGKQQTKEETSQPRQNDQPAPHIDEIV